MSRSIRAMNLYLSRFLFEGLGNVAKQVSSITNEAALIKMGQGKIEITEDMSRQIESRLNLPRGWMDRDNEALIRMTPLDYAIFKESIGLSDSAKHSLLAFLESVTENHNSER